MRSLLFAIVLTLTAATLGLSQIPVRPSGDSGLQKELDQFNTDVAVWNKRCKVTRSKAEEDWCTKERARIDAKRAELVRQGAIKK